MPLPIPVGNEQVNLPAPLDTPMKLSDLSSGAGGTGPIHVAMSGLVFDVSSNRATYGSDGSYSIFAGKDASRALAKSSLKVEDVTGDVSDLTDAEKETLRKWVEFFQKRYPIVGKLVEN